LSGAKITTSRRARDQQRQHFPSPARAGARVGSGNQRPWPADKVERWSIDRLINTVIEATFDVGRRFRCTMRIDCGQLDPGAVIRPVTGE
jgi:hypothetical protein